MDSQLIISCEHAGNEVPAAYRHLFEGQEDVLETHRGWDIGSAELAKTLSGRQGVEPHFNFVSRLVVEMNRSPGHANLFSAFSKKLSKRERQTLMVKYYYPYRNAVEEEIQGVVHAGQQAIHISVHTFTPVLNDTVRSVDVGFLYDPKRAPEKEFCYRWRAQLKRLSPELLCRMNAPYRGTADGLTTALRKKFTAERYYGIELEVNQKFVQKKEEWQKIQQAIGQSLEITVSSLKNRSTS